jgi:hypothetical protein
MGIASGNAAALYLMHKSPVIKFRALLLLLPLFLAACDIDVTRNPKYSAVIGHPITNKVPLFLYKPVDGYYCLDTTNPGKGGVGELPVGHPILFKSVSQYTNFDVETETLYGTTEFQGKTYPVCYECGDGVDADLRQGLHYVFGIPK